MPTGCNYLGCGAGGCPEIPSNIQKYTAAHKGFGNPNEIFANMGYVGYAVLRLNMGGVLREQCLRVNSSSLNIRQEITTPEVIDGRIDRTVYQLGPKIVEGDLTLPLIADLDPINVDPLCGCPQVADLTSTTASSLVDTLWCWGLVRNSAGRMMYDDAKLDVRYANHAAFTYDRVMVNRLSMTISESNPINVTVGLIARSRNAQVNPPVEEAPLLAKMLAPARILTWNDASIDGFRGCASGSTNAGGITGLAPLFFSNQVREFTLEANNSIERYYTLNGDLYPMDINARKREISGTIRLMGWNHDLSVLAEENQYRFTEKNRIRIAFYIGSSTYDPISATFKSRSGSPIFDKFLTGVVFKIEELSLTNELFETTVNYMALGNDQTNYEAFDPPTSCSFPPWA